MGFAFSVSLPLKQILNKRSSSILSFFINSCASESKSKLYAISVESEWKDSFLFALLLLFAVNDKYTSQNITIFIVRRSWFCFCYSSSSTSFYFSSLFPILFVIAFALCLFCITCTECLTPEQVSSFLALHFSSFRHFDIDQTKFHSFRIFNVRVSVLVVGRREGSCTLWRMRWLRPWNRRFECETEMIAIYWPSHRCVDSWFRGSILVDDNRTSGAIMLRSKAIQKNHTHVSLLSYMINWKIKLKVNH